MTINVNYNFNNLHRFGNGASFRAMEPTNASIFSKPIDKVEQIANSVDDFVSTSQDEEKKKSHKKMIRVGSIVLVLSAFGLMLNPKISSSLVNKLKTKTTKAANNAKVENSFVGAWNKVKEKFLLGLTHSIQILNNFNSFKDEAFQKLCNKTSVTKIAHNGITKAFDKISRHTVYAKYDKACKNMDKLDEIMLHYKERLSESEQRILEDKLREIDRLQEFFRKNQVTTRLDAQEWNMRNLEKDVWSKIKSFKDGYLDKTKSITQNTKDAYTFWAEDILMPERNRIEQEGKEVVDALLGDGKTKKGLYQEVIDLFSGHLENAERSAFEDTVKKAGNILRKANKSECVEYFDKKRDLVLGSAPTDIVTALGSLIACGVAIGAADSKEDRISRAITGVFPVIAGLGVSTALTAMLFSGGKGMALGTGCSMLLSAVGSSINHVLYPKQRLTEDNFAKNDNKNHKKEIAQA